MQTRVPDEYADWIKAEAEVRGVPCPELLRQVIVEGVHAVAAGRGEA
jgi:hypothetical protein